MTPLLNSGLEQFQLYLLLLFRVAGTLRSAPFWGSQTTPAQLQVGLWLLISLLLFPVVQGQHLPLPAHLGWYLAAVGVELALGLLIGFVASLVFAGIQLAGLFIDQELGFGLANIIDPITNEEVSVMGQLKFFLALVIFLGINGHHAVLEALAGSLELIPVMGMKPGGEALTAVSGRMVGAIFTAGLQISAPTVVALFFATIALGLAARTVPEMNLFMLGFAVRVGVGLLALVLSLTHFGDVVGEMVQSMTRDMRSTILGLR